MKAVAILAVICAADFVSFAGSTNSLEKLAPHFSTNTEIVWQAPTNQLPKNLWIYRRLPPQPFSAAVISNAIVLASLQDKGFPKGSTNLFCLDLDNCPCGHPCTFSMDPNTTTLSFSSPNRQNGSPERIPDEPTVAKRAWQAAGLFGLDRRFLRQMEFSSNHCDYDENDRSAINNLCERSVYLSRLIDGIGFITDNSGEGFSMAFGNYGMIRSFTLVWPNLERYKNVSIASPEQIIASIQARRTIVYPQPDEKNYFVRVKSLGGAKRIAIIQITPFYGEGIFDETPTNNEVPQIISPYAELRAVVDFGNAKAPVRLMCPIIAETKL